MSGIWGHFVAGVKAEWQALRPSDVAVLLAVGIGLFGLFDLLGSVLLQYLVLAALVVVLAISIPATSCKAATFVARLLAAALLALLALVGVDVVLNAALDLLHKITSNDHLRIPVWVGLILAVVVFAAAAAWYLNRLGFSICAAFNSGFGLAFLAILVTPLAVGSLNATSTPVSTPGRVPSTLDVLIVTDGRHHRVPSKLRTPALREFTVSYSVGVAAGYGVRWTLVGSDSEAEALLATAEGKRRPALSSRPTVASAPDSVLVLLVDGTGPVSESPAKLPNRPGRAGEVRRWKRIAAAAGAPETPTFALLQTTDPARLQRWKNVGAVSVQALQSLAVTDAAFRLAVSAPESEADYLLAVRYRPVLLFDPGEKVPWPLSIAAMFEQGQVRLCRNEGLRTSCPSEPTRHPDELENGSTSLRLDLPGSAELRARARLELERVKAEATPKLTRKAEESVPEGTPPAGSIETPIGVGEEAAEEPPGAGSAIYVHLFPVTRAGKKLLYLDYWWYLPDNPVELGGGALCGAGLVIAGVTCDNHQSDWEGMTVELDLNGAEPRPVALLYAQHDTVVRYRWDVLRKRWATRLPERVRTELGEIDDAKDRPLAFLASGTHATYPLPCNDCGQIRRWELGEEPHRGELPWVGDYSNVCGAGSCLQVLPTRNRGREPASWNAFDHPWGELDCFLVYYCDSGTPPKSPGRQGRYRHPAHADGYVGANGKFHPQL